MILFFLSCSREIPAAPSCEEGQETACFRGSFRTLLGSPVEDMKICAPEEENIECVWSDEEGTWKMSGLPKNTNVFLTAEHPDFVSTIFPQHTSMSWYDWYKVAIPIAVMNSNANRLDVELQENRGHMLFLVWEGLNIDGIDTENVEGIQPKFLSMMICFSMEMLWDWHLQTSQNKFFRLWWSLEYLRRRDRVVP